MKKELLASAPWRGDEENEKFGDAKLKVTNNPGSTPTMHVPRKRSSSDKDDQGEPVVEIDPELRYSFQRNFQFLQRVFSIDTLVKPLPPAIAYNVARNLNFFTRIFTQFWGVQLLWIFVGIRFTESSTDPEGIANAQKSLGLGQEQKARRVR